MSHVAKPSSNRKGRKARAVLERPVLLGWQTSDEDEVALRRWRGQTEIATIEALEPAWGVFGTFRVPGSGTVAYEVEIRSLTALLNSCGCIDHRVNGLGTCKHIEVVLAALRRRGVRAFKTAAAAGSPRVEVFLPRTGAPLPTILWPAENTSAVRVWLAPWLDADGALTANPVGIEALLAAWNQAPTEIRAGLRLSRHFGPWLERHRRSATACCIWRSANAPCSPTRWVWARRCRPSPPANCWRNATASPGWRRRCWPRREFEPCRPIAMLSALAIRAATAFAPRSATTPSPSLPRRRQEIF